MSWNHQPVKCVVNSYRILPVESIGKHPGASLQRHLVQCLLQQRHVQKDSHIPVVFGMQPALRSKYVVVSPQYFPGRLCHSWQHSCNCLVDVDDVDGCKVHGSCFNNFVHTVDGQNHCTTKDVVRKSPLFTRVLYGCFLKWWYPQNNPKWSFLVGKPMVVGYHHFRKPLCIPSGLKKPDFCTNQPGMTPKDFPRFPTATGCWAAWRGEDAARKLSWVEWSGRIRWIPQKRELGVSKNRGTQKWMVYNGKPY